MGIDTIVSNMLCNIVEEQQVKIDDVIDLNFKNTDEDVKNGIKMMINEINHEMEDKIRNEIRVENGYFDVLDKLLKRL